ncbi:MAG: hypothetical protein SGJ13_14230 [Actinomycetota bacterium]|nr:hypothetical protein [Actinomycetota bacterium]
MHPSALVAGLLAATLVVGACDSGDDDATEEPAPAVNDEFRNAQDTFLEFATTDLSEHPLSVVAHAERAARDDTFSFDAAGIGPEAFDAMFSRIDSFEDTTDFDVLYLLNLWYSYGSDLDPLMQAAIKERLVAFKYWYTEPTPPGVVDDRWYWSENHRIIFHVDEYLAGLAFPDETFTNDGRTGAEHAEHAKTRILEWLDEKVRFGFTEWHSDVYYQKDVTPLLTLVEFAPDDDLANRAAMVLDLFLLDIALHLQNGNFGATHGRSYMKDKSTALDQDTFGLSKLLFDDTSEPYQSITDAGAVLFARAQKYSLPEAIRTIATTDETFVDEERMNVPLDPLAEVTADPDAPYGYDFDDPENVPFWWERGAQVTWQAVPTTIRTLDGHGLWESSFFSPFKPLRDAVGDDMAAAQAFAHSVAPVLNFGLLTEVHTYTYRSPDVMLSSAQDHRFGMFSEQEHAWQATLDEHAIVFTTHPKNEPEEGTEWPDGDGYWTGTGSVPRSAQHGTAAIHIYAPAFELPGPPLDQFTYLPYTHAYFPREHFDEVVTEGNWTFGRRDEGYVALFSARPTRWREHDPARVFTRGLTEPFDLVAEGGPENVWVVEVGNAAEYETFAAFRTAIGAAQVTVDPDFGAVEYHSPSQGILSFAATGPLEVDGVAATPTEHRMANPFVTVPFEGRRYEITAGSATLVLDFEAWSRSQR